MCMSDSSRDYDSNGSHKSLKDRLQSKQGFDTDGIRRGLKNMGNTLQSMFSPKAESSVYSKGVRELDSFGYEKYNIEDDGEIFISKVPEKALFNDGEPIMVRATGGNFVGSNDSTSASIDIGEAQAKAEDFRNLFSNVQRGSAVETEYHATVGEVTDEGTIRARPIDRTFLEKMKAVGNEKSAPEVGFEEESVPEMTAETPVFLQIDDEEDAPMVGVPEAIEEVRIEDETEDTLFQAPVTEPVIEEVAEEPVQQSAFIERETEPQRSTAEFFVEDVDEPVVEESEESDEDDYSWVKFDEEVEDIEIADETEDMAIDGFDMPETVEPEVVAATEPVMEEVVEEPVQQTAFVEREVEDPVMDEAVIEEVSVETVAAETPEEVPIIEESEEIVAPETAVEEPVVEEIVEATVIDAPVENVAAMTLPGTIEVEPIAGLEMEGSEPSSESAAVECTAAVKEAETAVTGADVEPAPAPVSRFNGLEEDGEGLPKLSDPVIKRPRTVRFRFSNGVLQNVDSNEKPEPKEELRGPLA